MPKKRKPVTRITPLNPCGVCGGHSFYISNGQCLTCKRRDNMVMALDALADKRETRPETPREKLHKKLWRVDYSQHEIDPALDDNGKLGRGW